MLNVRLTHSILLALLVVASGFLANGAVAAGGAGAVIFSRVSVHDFHEREGEVSYELSGGLFASRDRRHLNQLTDDPADSQPACSPDGRIVAFVRDGDIWAMRADGTAQRAITVGEQLDGRPRFAPNGRYLLFERRAAPGAPRDLYTVRIGGGAARPLVASPADEHEATFSRNGRAIAFVRGVAREDGGAGEDVFTVRPSGAARRRLTRTGQLDEFAPRFFARGIVFNRGVHGDGPGAYADVYRMRADGRAIRPLVRGAGSAYVEDVAPNGRLLLFRRDQGLWLKPLAARRRRAARARKLVELGDVSVANAAFSADGLEVAAVFAEGAWQRLEAFDISTRKVERLATGYPYKAASAGGIGPVIAGQPTRRTRR